MEIKKEDLVYNHYTWEEGGSDHRQDMSPTRNTFDRNNGIHILWIANWYMAEHPGIQKADIAKLELLLSEKLPLGLLSEKSVCKWLTDI